MLTKMFKILVSLSLKEKYVTFVAYKYLPNDELSIHVRCGNDIFFKLNHTCIFDILNILLYSLSSGRSIEKLRFSQYFLASKNVWFVSVTYFSAKHKHYFYPLMYKI